MHENPLWPRLERLATLAVGVAALVTLITSYGVCTPSWKLQTVAEAQATEKDNKAEHDKFKESLSNIEQSLARIEGYLKGEAK
jgi:hypothetical protein